MNLNDFPTLKKVKEEELLLIKTILKQHKEKYSSINLGGCKCNSQCNRDKMICYKNKKEYMKALDLCSNDIIYATHENINKLHSGTFKGQTLWGHGHFILNYKEKKYFKKLDKIKNDYEMAKKSLLKSY